MNAYKIFVLQWNVNLVKMNSKGPNYFVLTGVLVKMLQVALIFQPYTYKPNAIRIRDGHLCAYLASYTVMGVCINRSNDLFYH